MTHHHDSVMQQLGVIARALIHDPKLVLMDEPFGALDALTREKMNLEMLRIWKESHKTFAVVTHSSRKPSSSAHAEPCSRPVQPEWPTPSHQSSVATQTCLDS